MTISSRIRRRTAIATAVITLGLAGFAAATPARAQNLSAPDSSAQMTITTAGAPDGTAAPDGSGFSCPTSQLQITTDVQALVVGVGCLNWAQGGNEEVQFSESPLGVYMSEELTLQGDGNFVFYNFSNNVTWASHTRLADNPNGPGTSASFQSDGNLVVRNAVGTAIWASNSHTYRDAILAFQSDGNLVIYESKTVLKALWASNTR